MKARLLKIYLYILYALTGLLVVVGLPLLILVIAFMYGLENGSGFVS